MDLLPMFNISSSSINISVNRHQVSYLSYSEYAQYSKSPEKKVQKEPEPEPIDLGR